MSRQRGDAWIPPADCPPAVAEAIRRIIEHWRVRIECKRARSNSARCSITANRGRLLDGLLRGRTIYTESELLDAISAYASHPFHRDNGAWRQLTGSMLKPGFLDDRECVEKWVNVGRELFGRPRQQRAQAVEQRTTEQQQQAAHQARMDAAAAALAALSPEARAERERTVLAGLTPTLQALCRRSAGNPEHGPQPITPTIENCRFLRSWVLIAVAHELEKAPSANSPFPMPPKQEDRP